MWQSVTIASVTTVFYVIESISQPILRSEEFLCAQRALNNNIIVVNNLTNPQVTEFYQDPNPNIFFPRTGLFTADFALGTVLNQK